MQFLPSHDAISAVCCKLLLQIAMCELPLTFKALGRCFPNPSPPPQGFANCPQGLLLLTQGLKFNKKHILDSSHQYLSNDIYFVWFRKGPNFAILFANDIMYQSVPNLTIPLGDPRGFAHSSCPWGRVFAPSSFPGSAWGSSWGVKNQSKSSIIFEKKNAMFDLSLKQMGRSSFHMFICARSEQCDLSPIYTITNTQRIRIYPGKLKFILVKI